MFFLVRECDVAVFGSDCKEGEDRVFPEISRMVPMKEFAVRGTNGYVPGFDEVQGV